MTIDIQTLQDFVNKKTFATRGFQLPITKKMWRDGYNKALLDFLTYIRMSQNPTLSESSSTGSQTEGDIK